MALSQDPTVRVSLPFRGHKATEAAALLLGWAGGEMGRLRLLKLLYLAEREALKRWSQPICGGHYVSMDHGPVLSEVYNLIKGEAWHKAPWATHIALGEHPNVRLAKPVDPFALSEREVELLSEIHERFGKFTDSEIWNYVHDRKNIPEYESPGGSSIPIDMGVLLGSLGFDADRVEQLRHDMRALAAQIEITGE